MTDNATYGRLRRHLDSLPVGFPRGRAGRRLLESLFSPGEALIGLGLDWRFRDEAAIEGALRGLGLADGLPLGPRLAAMAAKGSILRRKAREGEAGDGYALMPFVVGMFEFQVARLSRDFVEDTAAFFRGGFGLELLSSGEAQTRVIPVGAAIRSEHRIASHEESRALIRGAGGRVAVLPCVCRTGADLLGKPCRATERRELCMVFRDYADTVVREGWGRAVTTEEALALAAENEAEGLVMRPSNEAEPQFLCACCGDCCGLIAVVKAMRRPADFVASDFRARIEAEACVACGLCARRCPMEAIASPRPRRGRAAARARATGGGSREAARILEGRCIGCGACVGACPRGAVRLERISRTLPPRDTEALLERLAATRPGPLRRILIGLAGLLGLPRRGGRG